MLKGNGRMSLLVATLGVSTSAMRARSGAQFNNSTVIREWRRGRPSAGRQEEREKIGIETNWDL